MKVVATDSIGVLSERMQSALELPKGARFYRRAVQVNPFAYLERHSKQTSFQSEADYNNAVVATCLEFDIEVFGVKDH